MNNKYLGLSAALKGQHLPEQKISEKIETVETKTPTKKKGRRKGKRSDPDYEQVGVYIPKKLHIEIKKILVEHQDTDFSDLVSNLLQEWIEKQESNSQSE